MKTHEVITVHPQTNEQLNALKVFMQAFKIKFEVTKTKDYNPDFVSKIEESREEYKKGEFVSIESKDINSFLGLECVTKTRFFSERE